MKAKYSILSAALLCIGGAALLTSCADGDDFDYGKNGLLLSGTERVSMQKFTVEDTPVSYDITAKATRVVESDVHLTVAIDAAKLDEYNALNGTSYACVPESSVRLADTQLTIAAGQAVSTATTVSIVSTEEFADGVSYVIPVTIQSATGAGVDVIEASRTLFLRVSRVFNFHHLKWTAGGSSNFIFDASKHVDLPAYTVQFKFRGDGFGSAGNIQRVLAVEGPGEEQANMFRFGESGSAGGDILQWVAPGGGLFSGTHFAAGRWYLLTAVYDGSDFKMFVDDATAPDATLSAPGKPSQFQRFELGMSWGGYTGSQHYNGRLAEVRVWNKALSTSAIATGLCGVDPQSEGLVAYWKLDQAEGTTIFDATGHGYDMDWTQTSRDIRENGVMQATPDAAQGLQWGIDDNNKCAQ